MKRRIGHCRRRMETLEFRALLAESGVMISEFMALNDSTLIDGHQEYSDWIEIHNPTNDEIELTNWFLTDTPSELTRWRFPSQTISAHGYLLVFASGCNSDAMACVPDGKLHANFSLGPREFLALVRPDGISIESSFGGRTPYPEQRADVSFGWSTLQGSSNVQPLFMAPTPGFANSRGYTGFAPDPVVSHPSGLYRRTEILGDGPFRHGITLAAAPVDRILYTLDGSEPAINNPSARTYEAPLAIHGTTILRAIALDDGLLPSRVATRSYIVPDDVAVQSSEGLPPLRQQGNGAVDYDMTLTSELEQAVEMLAQSLQSLPVVSLSLDSSEMFGADGLYNHATERGPQTERTVSVEYFNSAARPGYFQRDAGIRIHGGVSRFFPKHSFRLDLESGSDSRAGEQGEGVSGPFFGRQQLVLRGGMGDSWLWSSATRSLYARDQFARRTQAAMGHLSASDEYVHLFINGLYWGLYDLSERVDADFAAAQLGGQANDYDVIRDSRTARYEAIDGTTDAWKQVQTLADRGLTSLDAYHQISQLVDLENFVDYLIVHMYVGAGDWPFNNWIALRDRNGGKFQFLVWDVEFGFDSSANLTAVDAEGTPGRLFAALRENAEFKLLFADRLQRHLFHDGVLAPSQVAARLSAVTSEIELALGAEEARWGNAQVGSIPFARSYGLADWQRERDRVLTRFVPTRTQIVFKQLQAAGLYPDTDPAMLSSQGGRVSAGTAVSLSSTTGSIYYTTDGSDPRLPGGQLNPQAQLYSRPILVDDSMTLIVRVLDGANWSAREDAVFVIAGRAASRDNLRITEVHYHPEPLGEAEFLEFTNTSQERIQLDGVQVEGGVQYRFGNDIQLGPAERLVLVRNASTFQAVYGGAIRVAGAYDGNLSNGGETIVLKDALGAIIQAFTYHDGGDWPQLADGAGFSLELLATVLDSSVPASWRASVAFGGTPGKANQPIGDANEDGRFDSSDLVKVFQGGHYETEALATWSTGDWNRDSIFTSADLVLAFQAGDYLAEAIATFATETVDAKLRRSELLF